MKTVLLDGNIYNKLEHDLCSRERIVRLSESKAIRVIATPKVKDELEHEGSPFHGIPNWFPVHLETESVLGLDHGHTDMADLGEGEVYKEHRGTSKQFADAIIADTADTRADVLVTEDPRFWKRLNEISEGCQAMKYKEFTTWLEQLEKTGR
jgi:hypothetical protein